MKVTGEPQPKPEFQPRSITIAFENQREMDVFAAVFAQHEMNWMYKFNMGPREIVDQMGHLGANPKKEYEFVRKEMKDLF